MTAGDALARLREALEANGSRVTGKPGALMAQCPAHEDSQPSLSLGLRDDGEGALIHCQTGCGTDAVLEALGLSAADLFDAPRVPGHRNGPDYTVTATYTYTDEAGDPLFYVERREPKAFRQYRMEGGRRIWKLGNTRRPLYRLPAVLAAIAAGEVVYVVEGEKDVHSIEAAGATATTSPGGAAKSAGSKWRPEHTATLTGAKVLIVSDADDTGRAHAATVAEALAGVAASVRLLEPARGKDATDHLSAGLKLEDLIPAAAASEPLTDLGYANRLVTAHGADMRYVATWDRWLIWDGRRWAEDITGQVTNWARQVARGVTREIAARIADEEGGKLGLLAEAKRHEKATAIRGSVTLAAVDRRIAITHTVLDAPWYLVNCEDCTLDLRSLACRPHDRADLLTKIANARYRPEARSPLWEEFLEAVQPGEAMRAYLGRLTGLALEGRVIEHLLAVHYGGGSNGKTTFLEAVSWALGDYAASADPELLIARRFEAHPTGVAALYGLRLALLPETDAGSSLAEGTVKRLTGGDRITARRMREDFWSFEPSHTFAMMTNHRPEVRGTDRGIWRRLKLVPWGVQVADDDQDVKLGDKLRDHADAVLAWLVAGYRDWLAHGLAEPAAVTEATASWREESDLVTRFLEERCQVNSAAWVGVGDLWSAWVQWTKPQHLDPGTQQRFGDALERAGYQRGRRKGRGRYWQGIMLYADGDTPDAPDEDDEWYH